MRKMKDSGIAWVGPMPVKWNIKRGKFTLRLLNRPINETDEVITCFRDGEVTLRKNRREDGFTVSLKEIGYQGIEPGDLVVHGMDGFAGSIGISDSRGKSSPVLVVCDSDENKKYIMYYLRSMAYNDVFTALATGIRVRSCDLRWNKIAELPYILPTIAEQNKIVQAIDNNTEKVDLLIANVQAQIEKLKGYKQSLITEKITMGLIGSVPTKESWVENQSYVPAHWNYVRGRYVAPVNKSVAMPDEDEYITYAPMECVRNDSFNPRAIQVKNLSSGLSSFAEGDVLLAKITPCFENGNVAIANNLINGVGAGSSELIAFTPIGINARFFMYYLQNTYFVESGKATIRGIGGLRRITSDFVENIALYIPDEIEQQEIVDFLDEKCSKIEALISIKQKKIEKLEQYKKSLIYEYVTGKKEVS